MNFRRKHLVKTSAYIVLMAVLCVELLPSIGLNQIEYSRCARLSLGGKGWLNIALAMHSYSDNGTISHRKCLVSYDFNKKDPKLYISFPDASEFYLVSTDCVCMINNENREFSRFHRGASLKQTYSVMKNHVLQKIRYMPYYSLAMPNSMQAQSQFLYIKQTFDLADEQKSKKCFIGRTKKMYMKNERTRLFTEPLQYECKTWINHQTFHIDSVIAYNVSRNSFHDTIKYLVTGLDNMDKSNYYDSLFDAANDEYRSYSFHDEKHLPYSMANSYNKEIDDEVTDYRLLCLDGDSLSLSSIPTWILLDLWQLGCQPCYQAFEKFRQERDSLGHMVLDGEDIRIIAANAKSDNMELIGKVAEKYEAYDLLYAGKGLTSVLSLVNHGFPSYYLISPGKEIVWRSNSLGDYSELLEAKENYEKQHKKM